MQDYNQNSLIPKANASLVPLTEAQSPKRGLVARGLDEMIGLVKPSFETAEDMFQKAQDYLYGKNDKNIDFQQAAKLFRESADFGHAYAQYQLAVMYAKGEGVPQDDLEAVYLYSQAAHQGVSFAQHSLGLCFELGTVVEEDVEEALIWYLKAAEQGHEKAQYALGNHYSDVLDRKQAAYWYKKAAEQSHLESQYRLGWVHIRGIDDLTDVKLGLQYFKSSAEAGYVPSMVWLGRRYMYGSPPFEEKDRDYKQAFYWYRKAAEQGDTEAKKALVRLLLKIKDKNT